MKKKHLLTLVPLLALGFLLSACGSAVAAGSWPGISYDDARGLVYVANNQAVHALQVENGLERWQFPAEPQGGFTTHATPELTEDGQLLIGGYDNILYSLNPDSGAQNWTFTGASNRYIGSPLAVAGIIFAPNADQRLYVLEHTGSLLRTFTTKDPQWSQPAGDGSTVYLAAMDEVLYAMDAQSGEELWSLQLEGAMVGSPVLGADGILYVGTFDKTLFAIDTATHREVWRFATQGWVWGSPALIEDQLYLGDLDGFFYALDAASGEELWRLDTGGAITGTPALYNENLIIGNEAGRLFSISLDGRSRELPLPEAFQGPLYGSPVVAGEFLLIGLTGNESALIALDADNTVVWNFIP
ncbi:MAG TPA: PQQ-binding-like beta-propeller repeat protein [Anaerolineales bacterium]